MMNKIELCFGPYENITPSGMDGLMILFYFSKVNSRLFGSPAEREASTRHRLIVKVAGGIDWVGDEATLVKVLFSLRVLSIVNSMSRTGDLPDEIPAFVTHGECSPYSGGVVDIEGTIIEVELPSMHTQRLERK